MKHQSTKAPSSTTKRPTAVRAVGRVRSTPPRRGEAAMGRRRINYRYYNPVDGRWTRRDPIGTNGGNNLYVFSQNAVPLNFDILGLSNCSQQDIARITDNLKTAADYYIKSPEKAVGLLRGLRYRSYVPIKITKGSMHCSRSACQRSFFGRIISSCKKYTSVSYYINLHIQFLYSDDISLEVLLRYVEMLAKIPGSEALKKLGYTTVPKVDDKDVKLEGRTYTRLCSENES